MLDFIDRDAKEVFEEDFLDFAGYNLQRRALPDARDGCKWGARKLLHAQFIAKLTYNKPFKKAAKSVAQATSFSYTHGPASAYGTLIRMAKPFAYRIPLQEANGNYGTLMNPNDHSADRYVELRGSEIAYQMLKDLDKDTIKEWEDTYDMEGKFPKVLPAKGFWNGVNGCISIGSGMASSLPPLNLKETNEAMIRLLWNPNISDDEILCYPDFPTGATILNKEEVRESLLHGTGFSCKIRATIEWEKNDRCFIVKEMPYSTFTNTICKELATLIEENEDCGIKDFADYTGEKPDLRIFLSKNASPTKTLKFLYKNTSLETFFAINMTVLDKGIYPVVMGQRQLFQAHLDHEKEVYTRGFQYDLKKISSRLHIIDGLIKAYDMIDEVVQTIKSSSTTSSASFALQKLLEIDEVQAKAILDLKLSRLSKLDITKLKNEKEELEKEKNRIEAILSDEILLKKEIEKGLREVAEKFGDERRTKILNVEKEEDEPIEKKTLIVNLTNKNNIFVEESSSLYTVRRGSVGSKFKLDKGEFVTSCQTIQTTDNLLLFTNSGYYYSCAGSTIPLEKKSAIESFLPIKDDEHISFISPITDGQYILFATKKGYLKKSDLSEYKTNRSIGIKAISLEEDDQIVSISLTHNEPVGILSAAGRFIMCETSDIRPIGRIARGIKGINLDDGDYVIAVKQIPQKTKTIAFISETGLIKQTDKKEFSVTGKNTKGTKVWKDKSKMADFLPLIDEQNILICNERAQLKIAIDEIPLLGKSCLGVKSSKIKDGQKIVGIIRT
ncbi:MAG: DNA topoisomerase (ATP-hydrolyzing) subunit A [Spirochaetia bacterium]|nr:DNA topoisomerase (ATP-hydrolyzing) subunit A [Spirochaetia bacterium]